MKRMSLDAIEPASRTFWSCASGILACALLLSACHSREGEGEKALRAVLEKYKATEGLLALGDHSRRGEPMKRGLDTRALSLLQEAEPILQQENLREKSPQTLNQLGIFSLLTGMERRAIQNFREAVLLDSEDPMPLNNLAVTYLHRGQNTENPLDFVRAVSLSSQALKRNPQMPEAAYNLGLALEALLLAEPAREAWQTFLQSSGHEAWRRDIQSRSHQANGAPPTDWTRAKRDMAEAFSAWDFEAVETTVDRFPSQSRQYAEWELLPTWAQATRNGEKERAEEILEWISIIGLILKERNGDSMLAETSEHLKGLQRPGDREAMARGLILLGDGRSAYDNDQITLALSHLEQATSILAEQDSPFAHWSEFYLIQCHFQRDKFGLVAEELRSLQNRLQRRQYPALHARTHQTLGIAQAMRSDFAGSLESSHKAMTLFKKIGEPVKAGRLAINLADLCQYLGRGKQAWVYHYEALACLPSFTETAYKLMVLQSLAHSALALEESEAALVFLNAALTATEEGGLTPDVFAQRAAVLNRLGLYDEARDDLGRAHALVENIPDAHIRQSYGADLAFLEGKSLVDQEPEHAIRLLTRALATYSASSHPNLAWVRFELGRAHLNLGQFQNAGAELQKSLIEVETVRQKNIRDESLPDVDSLVSGAYLGRVQPIYEAMIRFQWEEMADPESAFEFAERSQARDLLDRIGRQPEMGKAEPMRWDAVRQAIPAGVTLLRYAVLRDRTYLWLFADGQEDFHRIMVDQDRLSFLVETLRDGIQRKEWESLSPTSRQLYQWLIEPVQDAVEKSRMLVLAPDGPLHGLPFGALLDPGGRDLAAKKPLLTAPSASAYLDALRLESALPVSSPPKVLLLGNPSFEPSRFPELTGLPHAERECSRLKDEIYGTSAEVFNGNEATTSLFLSKASSSHILHFAGHALINAESPLESQLALAPSDGLTSLTARDLLGLRFDRTRLVVLSACGTATGSLPGDQGLAAFSYALQAAGVPTVIGSLWSVEDRATSAFFQLFHRHLASGKDPATALHLARLDCGDHPNPEMAHPASWSAFIAIGGASPSPPGKTKQGE